MSAEAAVEETQDSMKNFLSNLESTLEKSLSPLKDISKEMSSSKFGKNLKEFGKNMKEMGKAAIESGKMAVFMAAFEPFQKLLELFSPILNVINALFSVLVNEIFKALIPFVIKFSEWLIKLMPLFQKVGQIIGQWVIKGVQWLIKVFTNFWEKLKPIVAFIIKFFTPIWEKIWTNLKKVWTVLKLVWDFLKRLFIPIWERVKKGFQVLKEVWDKTGAKVFGKDGFIAKAMKGMFSIVKAIVNAIIWPINLLIKAINLIPGVEIPTIPTLAKGGLAHAPTLAVVGDNPNARNDPEVISPLSKLGQFAPGSEDMVEEQRTTNDLLGEMVMEQRRQRQWRHL
jgi:phage-related protein